MKIVITLFSLLFSSLIFCQDAATDPEFKKLISKAEDAYKAGDYSLCSDTYEKAFEIDDQNFFSLYRSAKCFALNNETSKSFDYLKKAIEINWKYTCQWMDKDDKLKSLNRDARWKSLKEECKKLESTVDNKLRNELLYMQQNDQRWRNRIPDPSDPTYEAHLSKLQEIDASNTQRMKDIVETDGWPTVSLVGEVGAHAAWLLVQHADLDPVFQEKCLGLLEAAYKQGEASGNNYAYLYDRVMVNKGEKQLFGTQVYENSITNKYEFHPIRDEANLNSRRSEYQLQWTAEEYAKVMGFEYQTLNQEEADAKSLAFQKEYDEMISSAERLLDKKDYFNASKSFKRAMEIKGSIKNEDIIKGARALAKSKQNEAEVIFAWLKMAIVRGWGDVDGLRRTKDFKNLKNDSRWDILDQMSGSN